MRSSVVHFVILWLALCGQAAGLALPGGGGLLCLEADGQAKVEFALTECCGPISAADLASCEEDEEDCCAQSDCTDELIAESLMFAGRGERLLDALDTVALLAVPVFSDPGFLGTWSLQSGPCFKPPVAMLPPGSSLVRTVILLL